MEIIRGRGHDYDNNNDRQPRTAETNSDDITLGGKQLFIYDEETNSYIPIKLDYSKARTPLNSPEGVAAANARMAEGAKADKALGVIVPLNKIRPNRADWVQLATIARNYPRENVIAIVNPTLDNRGVDVHGPGPDQEFINGIKLLQANGVMVVGYIFASSALDIGSIKSEIDKWIEWYPDVQGVFFSTMETSPESVDFYKELNDYAKAQGLRLTIGDMTYNMNVGDPVKPGKERFFERTGIDIFVVYDMVGFPTDSHFNAYKKDWIPKHSRSKFAWIVTGVPDNDVLACNNFVDRLVGIEKLGGYVYVYPELGIPNDDRAFHELDTISPYLETTLIQLDRQAAQEKIPYFKGVIPATQRIAEPSSIGGRAISPEAPEVDNLFLTKDTLGITKIYPTVESTIEWQAEYIEDQTQLKPIRLDRIEAWSYENNVKYLNTEVTGYFKFALGATKSPELLRIWTRAGNDSGYIGVLGNDGIVHIEKQINKLSRTGMRAQTQATNQSLENRWIGLKFVVYNYLSYNVGSEGKKAGQQTIDAVQMEFFVDDNVTNQDGSLAVKNDWKKIMSMNDEGGWIAKVKNSGEKKKKTTTKTKTNKKTVADKTIDTILIEPGGKEKSNAVFFELPEYQKTQYRYLSVREIHPPRRD